MVPAAIPATSVAAAEAAVADRTPNMAAAPMLRERGRAHRQRGDTAADDQRQRTERRGFFHNVTADGRIQ
jgi:hypothetical protein